MSYNNIPSASNQKTLAILDSSDMCLLLYHAEWREGTGPWIARQPAQHGANASPPGEP